MAKLRMAHASTHGAHKPPGPTSWAELDHMPGMKVVFVDIFL